MEEEVLARKGGNRWTRLGAAVGAAWMSVQMELVQKSIEETAELDRLLISVISQIRQELGLPFDEAFYAQIIETGHKSQAEFLEEFIRDLPPEFEM